MRLPHLVVLVVLALQLHPLFALLPKGLGLGLWLGRGGRPSTYKALGAYTVRIESFTFFLTVSVFVPDSLTLSNTTLLVCDVM